MKSNCSNVSPAGFACGVWAISEFINLNIVLGKSKTSKSNVQAITSKLTFARIIVHVHAKYMYCHLSSLCRYVNGNAKKCFC